MSACLMIMLTVITFGTPFCYGGLVPVEIAPEFSLKDMDGNPYNLDRMKTHPMMIIYFFSAELQASQEGLLSLDKLAKEYVDADLLVWGVTRSPKKDVQNFISRTHLSFPVLLDKTNVSDLYKARQNLPTVYIVGPGLQVLDQIRGDKQVTEIMLTHVAERKLQRKQFKMAKNISVEAERKDPQNPEAKMVQGYAALKEGNLQEAETTFRELSETKGKGEVLGKEGLADVYAQKGETEKALKLANEVEKKAPDRAYVHVVKGNIYYNTNKKKLAEAEFQKAVKKTSAAPFQKAAALNHFGRLEASKGNYQTARKFYDQAVEIDPYDIVATSNKGVTYEKEGKWDKALDTYRQGLAIDKKDIYVSVLAKRAQERLSIQNDAEKKKRMDKLVNNLVKRYHTQKKTGMKVEDTWTSRPMILTFVDFQEKGGLAERDGFSTVLTSQLSGLINASGRAQVVERVLVERVLEELNIGSSEMANPETALRLGKLFAAKIIGTGSFYHLTTGTLLSLRLIDTETSAIPKVVTRQIAPGASLEKEINRLNRDILKSIITKYPLRGFVVQATEDQVLINLGLKQGVVLGAKFDVIKEQEPIEYKGKKLQRAPKVIAQIEVEEVEPDLCYARILNQKSPINSDDKVKEKVSDIK
jgi:tetratricopeptide (TPR) repeat protein